MNKEIFHGLTPSVPSGFLKDLKAYNKDLDCKFCRKRGRFVLTHKGDLSGEYEVAIVEGDEGGGYRYPDNRDIRTIYEADRYHRSRKQRERESAEYMRKYRDDEDNREASEIRDRTKDGRRQLMKAYTKAYNLGKCESTFRKVKLRPKGKVEQRDGFVVIDRINKSN
jgi:hypothetical protein